MDIYLRCISFQFWNTFVLILKHFCIQIYIVIQVECFKFLLLLLLIQVECFKFLLLLLLSFHSHSEWALSLTGLDLCDWCFKQMCHVPIIAYCSKQGSTEPLLSKLYHCTLTISVPNIGRYSTPCTSTTTKKIEIFFASSNSSKSLKGVEYRPILGTLMVIWLECSDTVWTVKAQLIHVRNSRQ